MPCSCFKRDKFALGRIKCRVKWSFLLNYSLLFSIWWMDCWICKYGKKWIFFSQTSIFLLVFSLEKFYAFYMSNIIWYFLLIGKTAFRCSEAHCKILQAGISSLSSHLIHVSFLNHVIKHVIGIKCRNWGFFVAKHPWTVLLVSLVIPAIFCVGVTRFKVETRPEKVCIEKGKLGRL